MRKKTFQNKLNTIRKKAINATANVLSAPAQAKSAYVKSRSDYEVKIIKNARKYEGMPDFINGSPSEGYKARLMAEVVKDKIRKRNAKK